MLWEKGEVMAEYPRFLTPDFKPFNPIELAKRTEGIICRKSEKGLERKYTAFYATGVYGGIATGYAVGCCLRCYYCWTEWSRDFPEIYGEYHSPREAFKNLDKAAKKYGVNKLRISGCEPTLCREHLLQLLEYVEDSRYPLFILETNGILFGWDESYVKEVARFEKVHVRVSLKAATPKTFTARTGAAPEFWELPFKAVEHLYRHGASFHVAVMSDPRIMPADERRQLIERLREIDVVIAANLEEELCDPYETTVARMAAYGVDPMKFFSKRVELWT